jgi:hypothetical protein
MRAQLRHLLDLAALPAVDVRMLPAASAVTAGAPFGHVRFPVVHGTRMPDTVLIRCLHQVIRLDDERTTFLYARAFGITQAAALTAEATAKALGRAAARL